LLFTTMEDILDGRIDTAEPYIMEIRAIFEASQDTQGALAATLVHADACYWRGQYHQAAELYQQVLAKAVDQEDPSDRPYALYSLGCIQYEWNEVTVARQGAEKAIETARAIGDDHLLMQATLLLARADFASGQADQARQRLDALVTSALWPQFHREVRAWQVRFDLWSGDLTSARRGLEALAREGPPAGRMQQELEDFVTARLEIAQGKAGDALPRLKKWHSDALAEGRVRSEIEALILQALACFSHRDEQQARQALFEAFDLAQAGDHRRLFIDEGEPMISLLKAILAEHDEPYTSYARVLLHSYMETQLATSEAALANPLIEPLSAQERRVLRLLVAGLSNAEIAEELVVSVNTIKTQLKSIYHKLSVRSREEARDAAHDLHLI
jgi:LuxR family maltose regulon positive regulatory protein